MPACAICGSENPAGKKFCGDCGAALGNRCPHCGADNATGKKFCGDCGTALKQVESREPTVESQELGHSELSTVNSSTSPGERRQLTVLFCDLVGSTAMSQQIDAEEWRDVIADYQKTVSDAVARFGGHVAKNLGDGLLIWVACRT